MRSGLEVGSVFNSRETGAGVLNHGVEIRRTIRAAVPVSEGSAVEKEGGRARYHFVGGGGGLK